MLVKPLEFSRRFFIGLWFLDFAGSFWGLAPWKAVLAGWQIVGLEFSCERHGHQSC